MIIPKPYEVQAAAQIEFAGDRGKQEAFAVGVAWALEDAESGEEKDTLISELVDMLKECQDRLANGEASKPSFFVHLNGLIEKATKTLKP